MPTFYYTYGADRTMPYCGGWTEITAENRRIANGIFQTLHPNLIHRELLNCASSYDEDEFKKSKMYEQGNLGAKCHEKINVSIDICDSTKNTYILSEKFTLIKNPHIANINGCKIAIFTVTSNKETYEKLFESAVGYEESRNINADRVSHLTISFSNTNDYVHVAIIFNDKSTIDTDLYYAECQHVVQELANIVKSMNNTISDEDKIVITSIMNKYLYP